MYVGSDFQASDAGESEIYSFDFVNDIAAGETLGTATFTLATVSGTDSNPSLHIQGSAQITGTIAMQRISGLLNGVTYAIQALVTTSNANVLSLWSHIIVGTPR